MKGLSPGNSSATYPSQNGTRRREKERRWLNGTRPSSVPQSTAQAVGFHYRLVWEVPGDAYAPGPGSPIAENVPILRLDHLALQTFVFGVWEIA